MDKDYILDLIKTYFTSEISNEIVLHKKGIRIYLANGKKAIISISNQH